MDRFFTPEYSWLWALALTVALYYPVRQLIWTLQVRRAERDGERDETRRAALKKRASVSSALLCFVFSWLYSWQLFSSS
jgi:hypothetical protein